MIIKDIIILEIFIVTLMTLAIAFLALTKKEMILSPKGREKLHQNLGTIKLATLFTLASMLFYLFAETAEIIGELFEEIQDVTVYESVHAPLEAVHLFILIFGLGLFLYIIGKVGED